jgi:hypothetical protein
LQVRVAAAEASAAAAKSAATEAATRATRAEERLAATQAQLDEQHAAAAEAQVRAYFLLYSTSCACTAIYDIGLLVMSISR